MFFFFSLSYRVVYDYCETGFSVKFSLADIAGHSCRQRRYSFYRCIVYLIGTTDFVCLFLVGIEMNEQCVQNALLFIEIRIHSCFRQWRDAITNQTMNHAMPLAIIHIPIYVAHYFPNPMVNSFQMIGMPAVLNLTFVWGSVFNWNWLTMGR